MEILDAEVIVKAQNGDHESFAKIYEAHKSKIYSLCLRMVKNPIDAEDMMQEVFLHLFRFLKTYEGRAKFSTWLYRVAFSVVLWKLRPKRLTTVSLDEERESATPLEIGTEDLRIRGTLDRVMLERALAELPEGYRFVFLLHDMYGYEHSEITAIIGNTLSASKSQLHDARLRLRSLLRAAAIKQRRRSEHCDVLAIPQLRAKQPDLT